MASSWKLGAAVGLACSSISCGGSATSDPLGLSGQDAGTVDAAVRWVRQVDPKWEWTAPPYPSLVENPATGEVVVLGGAGKVGPTYSFGSGQSWTTPGSSDGMAVSISSDNIVQWFARFSGPGASVDIAGGDFRQDGSLVVAGNAVGTVDLGLGAQEASGAYVAALDQGNTKWVNLLKGGRVIDLAAGPGNTTAIFGLAPPNTSIDWGCAAMSLGADKGAYLVSLRDEFGKCKWMVPFEAADYQFDGAVEVTSEGSVVVTGFNLLPDSSAEFAARPGQVVGIDGNGKVTWSRNLMERIMTGYRVASLAADSHGNVYSCFVRHNGTQRSVVTKLGPSGATLWEVSPYGLAWAITCAVTASGDLRAVSHQDWQQWAWSVSSDGVASVPIYVTRSSHNLAMSRNGGNYLMGEIAFPVTIIKKTLKPEGGNSFLLKMY